MWAIPNSNLIFSDQALDPSRILGDVRQASQNVLLLLQAAYQGITGIVAWLRLGYALEGNLLIHLILASSSILMGIGALTQRETKAYLILIGISGLLVCIAGHFGGNMIYG